MKLAFIASFIIGGLLWLSVFQVNNNMFSHSGRQTLYQSVKVKNEALAQLLERDLRRVGFRVPDSDDLSEPLSYGNNGIVTAKNDEFVFVSMFEGPESTVPVVLSWKYSGPTDCDSFSEVINDEITLIRTTTMNGPPDEVDYEVGAACFSFRYFDRNMEIINESTPSDPLTSAQLNEVRHVGFIILSQSEQRYGDRFERHALERTVTPRNLTLNVSS